MKENIIQNKSYKFAIRTVNLYKYLVKEKKEFVLSKQILRSGTSIGANVEEALGGQSKKDFLNKMSIAYKEARETGYWLKLLKDSNILAENHFYSIYQDLEDAYKKWQKRKISENSWTVKVEDIIKCNYDLSAKNPNKIKPPVFRKPEELVKNVMRKEKEIEEILASLQKTIKNG